MSRGQAATPPRLARLLLRLALRGEGGEVVQGDIDEELALEVAPTMAPARARAWYWRQVLGSIAAWWRPAAVWDRRTARRLRQAHRRPARGAAGRVLAVRGGGSAMIRGLWTDGRYAARTLTRRPAFALLAISAVALGVGATTTVFSVVDGVLLRPLPYRHAERMAAVGTTSPRIYSEYLGGEGDRYRLMGVSVGNFLDWRHRATSFEALTAAEWSAVDLLGEGGPERVRAALVSDGFFDTLSVTPARGRLFSPEEHRAGGPQVALLSHGAWKRRFGADPQVVGGLLETTESRYTIVGVLPADYRPPEALHLPGTEIYLPLTPDDPRYRERGFRSLAVMGLLRPGVTIDAARREMWALSDSIAEEFPEGNVFPDGSHFGAGVNDLHAQTVGSVGRVLAILLGAVGFLLLIACANVANLFLVRGLDRQHELALRASMGAPRARIVRQLLLESTLLALAGGAAGVLLARVGLDAFQALSPGDVPRLAEVQLDLRVLAFALLVSAGTGLAFGLFPALQLTRKAPVSRLREGGGGTTAGRTRSRYLSTMVILETSLAFVLTVGAGLLFTSFLRLIRVEPGFNPESTMTFRVAAPGGFEDREATPAFWTALLEELQKVPGVEAVAAASNIPMQSVDWRPGVLLGEETEGMGRGVDAYVISPGFFRTLEIPLLAGRQFEAGDREGAPRVVMVNQAFVREVLGASSGVGKRLRMTSAATEELGEVEIVGVVGDARQLRLASPPEPAIYVPYGQAAWPLINAVVRVRPGFDVAARLRQAVWAVDPTLPVEGLTSMEAHLGRTVMAPRFYTAVLVTFAAIALLLAGAGTYATMLYSVARRTREVGIRVALGARHDQVVRQVLGRGLAVTGLGIALGLLGSMFASKALVSFLFGVEPTDPLTLTVVACLLGSLSLIACYLPARRAARVDPVVALRSE